MQPKQARGATEKGTKPSRAPELRCREPKKKRGAKKRVRVPKYYKKDITPKKGGNIRRGETGLKNF